MIIITDGDCLESKGYERDRKKRGDEINKIALEAIWLFLNLLKFNYNPTTTTQGSFFFLYFTCCTAPKISIHHSFFFLFQLVVGLRLIFFFMFALIDSRRWEKKKNRSGGQLIAFYLFFHLTFPAVGIKIEMRPIERRVTIATATSTQSHRWRPYILLPNQVKKTKQCTQIYKSASCFYDFLNAAAHVCECARCRRLRWWLPHYIV
jgi:hypothetical protein